MTTTTIRTAALVLAGFTLTAAPLFAQRRGSGGSPLGERATPREERSPRSEQAPRPEQRRPEAVAPRTEQRSEQRSEQRAQRNDGPRAEQRSPRNDGQRFTQRNDGRRFEQRNDRGRYSPRFDNRYRGGSYARSYYSPFYRRSYTSPYGYRLYGYRPGLSLYFGLPYDSYGYSGYRSGGYGYYTVVPGRVYGSLRIVDAPEDAQVFVDGNYAGIVDDYDGVFQRLNLEPGAHRIELEAEGYSRIEFDVRIVSGETVTYHARF